MTTKNRVYTVWIKGQRATTERLVEAPFKLNALIKFAAERGIKSYQCDGLLAR